MRRLDGKNDYYECGRIATALLDMMGTAGGAGHSPVTLSASAETIMTIGEGADPQELTLDVQDANKGWFGPTSGSAEVPTFRLISTDDLSAANLMGVPSFTLSTTNAEGSSASLVRCDAQVALFDVTAPTTISQGDAAAVGSGSGAARYDHAHGINTSNNPGASASILATAADGGIQLLRLGIGTDPDTDNAIKVTDDAWAGLGSAAGRIIFDSTTNPDQVQLAAADLYLPASHGIVHADGVTAGYVLRADGTRYVPASATGTIPFAPTAQGDMIIADATPAWSRLATPGAAGYALVSTATTEEWSQTPTWTDGHQWSSARNALAGLAAPTNYHATLFNPANDTGEGVGLGFYISNEADDVGAAIVHRRTDSHSKGTLQFYTKQDAVDTNPPTLVLTMGDDGISTFTNSIVLPDDASIGLSGGGNLTFDSTPATDEVRVVSANLDLNGNDLILDTDGDSYLHAAGDDHAEFVLATASGQLDVNINGADDFTFTANSLNVLSSSYITMADDTWIGLGAAAGRMVFDSTATPDEIHFEDCAVSVGLTGGTANLNVGESAESCTANVITYSDTLTDYSYIRMQRSHSDTLGTVATTQDTELIGGIVFYGTDTGPAFDYGAFIVAQQEGNAGAHVPTKLRLYTYSATSSNLGACVNAAGDFGVNMHAAITAQCHVDQADEDGAQPVLLLDQADVDVEFISFTGEAAAADLTRSIVDEGDQGSATIEGWLKIYVTDVGNQVADQAYFVPFYTLAA